MTSEPGGREMNEEGLRRFVDEVMKEPMGDLPPEVEARYLAMIRSELARRADAVPGWRSIVLLVACVSIVLMLVVAPAFSPTFTLVAVASASGYGALVRMMAAWPVYGRA